MDPLVPVISSEAATWQKLSQSDCSSWRMYVPTSTPQWVPCQLVQEEAWGIAVAEPEPYGTDPEAQKMSPCLLHLHESINPLYHKVFEVDFIYLQPAVSWLIELKKGLMKGRGNRERESIESGSLSSALVRCYHICDVSPNTWTPSRTSMDIILVWLLSYLELQLR